MTCLKYLFGLCILAVIGCGVRSDIVVVPKLPEASVHEVLFATNRAPNARLFGAARSSLTSYGTVRVSVPPSHQVGVVEYPGAAADAKTKFGIVDAATSQNPAAFVALLQNQAAKRPKGTRRAVVFVHGYNNTFAEALYMNTQIIHDYQSPDIPVLFSWQSAGENLGYCKTAIPLCFRALRWRRCWTRSARQI